MRGRGQAVRNPELIAGGALAGPLTFASFGRRFSTLVHVEELQMEVDIARYTMDDARLVPSGRYLALTVPGLAEKRPSLLVGDAIHARQLANGVPAGPFFEGCVHAVRLEEVLLRFNQSFHDSFIAGLPMSITFTFNRMPLRRQHEALSPAKLPRASVLFPRPSVDGGVGARGGELGGQTSIDWLSSVVAAMGLGGGGGGGSSVPSGAIKGNPEQVLAVKHILAKSSGDRPYIVFGPPGTGKTTTVIEGDQWVLGPCIVPQKKFR